MNQHLSVPENKIPWSLRGSADRRAGSAGVSTVRYSRTRVRRKGRVYKFFRRRKGRSRSAGGVQPVETGTGRLHWIVVAGDERGMGSK